jgi:TIR domain
MEMPYLAFCCYARKDQNFLQDLKTHLKPLEHEGLINIKADIDISPGTEWEITIIHHLEVADIILLLISPDFIASDYCFNEEMRQAIARHEQGTAHVVPVIIRPVSWHTMPFSKLQALPKDATPISMAPNTDTAFLNVAQGIRTVIQELMTGITVNRKPGNALRPSAQEDLLPISSQERNNMDTKDDSSRYTIKNKGPVHGQVIGGQHGQVISEQNIYIPNKQKDGILALKKGVKALLNEDYASAKKELRVAIEEIDQEQQKEAAAKARYLQALAVLGNERPRDKGIVATEKINALLNAAISLDRCNAYVMASAVIRDPSLRKQANSTHITNYDEELLAYLKRCQPDLYHQVCQVFSI